MINNNFILTDSSIKAHHHLADEAVAYAKEHKLDDVIIYTEENGKEVIMYKIHTAPNPRIPIRFDGISISPFYPQEGLKHAKKYHITSVCFTENILRDHKVGVINIDFSLFEQYDFIDNLHFVYHISKRSKVEKLKALKQLKYLRMPEAGLFDIDFSWFKYLEGANIGYSDKIKGLGELEHLNRLQMGSTHIKDLSFIKHLPKLEYMRILGAKFTSLEGLENCPNLTNILIQDCRDLIHINETLKNMPKLRHICISGSKKINVEKELEGIDLTKVEIVINRKQFS